MKRNIFTLLVLCVASLTSSAQTQRNILSWNHSFQPQLNSTTQQVKSDYQRRFKNATTRDESAFWISYAFDADSLDGGLATLSGNYLFPDSSVLVNFDDGAGGTVEGAPFIHELGDIVDPLAFVFQFIDGVNFTASTHYYVDSAGLYMAYQRNTDASVVDTAIVYMYEGAVNSANLPEYYYPGELSNFGYDTIYVLFQNYDTVFTHNKPIASAMKTFKIPLFESDSSSFYFFKSFSTNHMSVPAGHKVAMAITFKPGYAYNPGDNVTNTGNILNFASFEENGSGSGGTFPTYIPDEWNVSNVISTSVRYSIDTFGYNGVFIPCYAWTIGFSFERHLFLYKVTDGLTGINDPSEAFGDFSITPNPADDYSRINFSLNTTSDVTISIYDVTGKVLTALHASELGKGEHSQMLDVSKLNAGVYMVTLESGKLKSTQKLIVTR